LLQSVFPTNGTSAEIAEFKHDMNNFMLLKLSSANLKLALVKSLSSTISNQLEDPHHGYSYLSIRDILMFVHKHYGNLTSCDIEVIYQRLYGECNEASLFLSVASNIVKDIAMLKQANVIISEYDKEKIVFIKFKKCPQVMEHMVQYQKLHPVLLSRSLTDVLEYTTAMLENTYNTYASTNSSVHQLTIQEQIDAAVKLALATAKLTNKPKPASKSVAPPAAYKYCWVHGFNQSHEGVTCRTMLADTNTYTSQHRNCTAPVIINEKDGNAMVWVPYKSKTNK
jgi:hypothetical protein